MNCFTDSETSICFISIPINERGNLGMSKRATRPEESRHSLLNSATSHCLYRSAASFGLTPMREELQLAPGAQHSGVLMVSNDAPGKVRVVAELLDFYIDAETTPQFP